MPIENLLQNKNQTDLPIITVKTLKRILDQFHFVFYFFDQVYFGWLIFSENKKELSQKK